MNVYSRSDWLSLKSKRPPAGRKRASTAKKRGGSGCLREEGGRTGAAAPNEKWPPVGSGAHCVKVASRLAGCVHMWAKAGDSKIRHSIKRRRPSRLSSFFLFSPLFMISIVIKQRRPPSLFSVPQSSRWAQKVSHCIFLTCSFECELLVSVWPNWSREAKTWLDTQAHFLSHSGIQNLLWPTWIAVKPLLRPPLNPVFPIRSLEMYFLFFLNLEYF